MFLKVTITNVASNTATANVLVPILAKMAVTMCINPIYLTLPAGTFSTYPAFSSRIQRQSFRNCLLLCLCPSRGHSPQRHRVWAQQHEDGRHDEGGLCDEPHLRHHPGDLHQQLCCPTLWAGRVPRLGSGCSSQCVSLLPVRKEIQAHAVR